MRYVSEAVRRTTVEQWKGICGNYGQGQQLQTVRHFISTFHQLKYEQATMRTRSMPHLYQLEQSLNLEMDVTQGAAASVVQRQRAGLWYPSSRVQTRPKSLDFSGRKILSTSSFGGKVKPSVPRRRFTACKRSLNVTWKSDIFRQNSSAISRPCSSTFGCQDLLKTSGESWDIRK